MKIAIGRVVGGKVIVDGEPFAGFADLPKTEQIQYLQALWDRISESPGEIPVPESHLRLARERLTEYRGDPSRAEPARAVLDKLRSQKPAGVDEESPE